MKQSKVISRKNLPHGLGLGWVCVGFLLMDKYNAPDWGWGVFWTLWGIIVIANIVRMATEDSIEITDFLKGQEKV